MARPRYRRGGRPAGADRGWSDTQEGPTERSGVPEAPEATAARSWRRQATDLSGAVPKPDDGKGTGQPKAAPQRSTRRVGPHPAARDRRQRQGPSDEGNGGFFIVSELPPLR